MESWDANGFIVWHISLFWLVFCLSAIVLLLARHASKEGMLRYHRKDRRTGPVNFARLQVGLVAVAAGAYAVQLFFGTAPALGDLAAVLLAVVAISSVHFLLNHRSAGRRR